MRGGEVRVVALADITFSPVKGRAGRGPPSPQLRLERPHPQKSDPPRPLQL